MQRTPRGRREASAGAPHATDASPPPPAAGGRDAAPYVFITVGTTSFEAFISAACSAEVAAALAARGFRRVVMQVGRGAFAVPEGATAVATGGGSAGGGPADGPSQWTFQVRVPGQGGGGGGSAVGGRGGAGGGRQRSRSRGGAGSGEGGQAAAGGGSSSSSSGGGGSGGGGGVTVTYEAYRFKASISGDVSGAGLVISHAGAGSIFESLRAGKPLVVVVNTALADNHQTELAEALGGGGAGGSGSGPHLAWCEPAGLAATLCALHVPSLRPLPAPDTSRFTAALDALMGFT
jgi:UDP-N-acetylglucosamine transferase subunit ALG13